MAELIGIKNADMFTSSKMLNYFIENNELYIQFVGYVVYVRKLIKNDDGKFILIFGMSNGEKMIKVIAEDELAVMYSKIFTSINKVFSLVKVKVQRDYNLDPAGVFPYELQINPDTQVTLVGEHQVNLKLSVEFADLNSKNHGNELEIEGFLQMEFSLLDDKNMYIGSITDGHFKLNIAIENDGYFEERIPLGTKVQLTGLIMEDEPVHYLFVRSILDVKIFENCQMPIETVVLGFNPLFKAT